MSLSVYIKEFSAALGTPRDVMRKVMNAWRTIGTTFNSKERQGRLNQLKSQGLLEAIPTEWQIWNASRDMLFNYIIPSNGEFYEHYEQNQYWLQFLRVFDEPSTMMDPTGLAVSRDMVVSHLLHVVHISAAYDVGLLQMFPDGISELESQLEQYVAGEHPRQSAIATLLERQEYPAELLGALKLYKENPQTHWKVTTFETPGGCEELLEEGLERYGTLGRLLNYSLTLPPSPWASLCKRLGLGYVST